MHTLIVMIVGLVVIVAILSIMYMIGRIIHHFVLIQKESNPVLCIGTGAIAILVSTVTGCIVLIVGEAAMKMFK